MYAFLLLQMLSNSLQAGTGRKRPLLRPPEDEARMILPTRIPCSACWLFSEPIYSVNTSSGMR